MVKNRVRYHYLRVLQEVRREVRPLVLPGSPIDMHLDHIIEFFIISKPKDL